MKKIKLMILIVIIIIFILTTLILINTRGVVIINKNSEFNLDTEFKYIVVECDPNPAITDKPLSSHDSDYYEIDLEKKVVDSRRDNIPTLYYYGDNNILERLLDYGSFYNRKLIRKKVLTDEETNQLAKLLKEVVQEGKTTYDKSQHKNFGPISLLPKYYSISNKEKTNVIMDDATKIDKFLEIAD